MNGDRTWLGRFAGPRCGLLAVVGLALLIAPERAAADESPTNLVPVSLEIGFSDSSFLQTNRNDVEAAFRVLVEAIGRKRGYRVAARTRFFANEAEVRAGIRSGSVHLIVLDAMTYVAVAREEAVTPNFVTAQGGQVGRQFLLLTHRDSGLKCLADLRGRSLVEMEAPDLTLGDAWLGARLGAQGLPRGAAFFGEIEHVGKPSAAVLPVFFGRRAACVVDRDGFAVMKELNPQVGAELVTLETSEPFAGCVIATGNFEWAFPAFKPVLVQALDELHREPAGQQILALFKIDQLVAFQQSQLDTVRALWSAGEAPADGKQRKAPP